MVDVMVATVTGAATGGKLPVRLGTESRALVCDRQVAATAAVGDQVLVIVTSGTGWVTALLSTAPGAVTTSTAEAPPPAPEQTAWIADTAPVAPVWTGTWRSSKWLTGRNDLGQGNYGWGLNQGAAFFGRGLRSLTLLSGTTVRLRREDGGVFGPQTPTMRLLAGYTLPSSYPAVLATAPGPALSLTAGETREANWTIPAAWLPRLSAGGDAGGIGIGVTSSTPYMWIDGPGMVVTARYERKTT